MQARATSMVCLVTKWIYFQDPPGRRWRRWRRQPVVCGLMGGQPIGVVVQYTPFHLTVILGTWYLVHSIQLSATCMDVIADVKKSMDDHLMSPNSWSKLISNTQQLVLAQALRCRCCCSCSSSCCLHAMQMMNSNTCMTATNKLPKQAEPKYKVVTWYRKSCMV